MIFGCAPCDRTDPEWPFQCLTPNDVLLHIEPPDGSDLVAIFNDLSDLYSLDMVWF